MLSFLIPAGIPGFRIQTGPENWRILSLGVTATTQQFVRGNADCGWHLLDHPILGVAGLDHRLELVESEAVDGFEVEALAAAQIGNRAKAGVNPLLCASPVAVEYLDWRSIRRSASCNIETLSVHTAVPCGRADPLDFKDLPIPRLVKARRAPTGKYYRAVR